VGGLFGVRQNNEIHSLRMFCSSCTNTTHQVSGVVAKVYDRVKWNRGMQNRCSAMLCNIWKAPGAESKHPAIPLRMTL
jgi:hypothetical protein